MGHNPCVQSGNRGNSLITALLTCCCNDVFVPQVKRIFTRKLTIGLILGYVPIQALGVACQFVADAYWSEVESDPISYQEDGYYWELTPCAQRRKEIASKVKWYTSAIVTACPNVIMYALLLLGTTLFVIVFRKGIVARKSLTAKREQIESSRERRLMQSVLVVCIIFILTSGLRSVARMLRYFSEAGGRSGLLNDIVNFTHNSSFSFVVFFLQAINHCFNIFVYLLMNSKFRRSYCKMFCLKRCNGAN